ncbi:hypothetical protein QYE76_034853 [Lolium multiflorum]|uniref:Uncharacterized protein n=1 Tax=Lolium multiflorum TaxID=4521 RepID=A0AAD8VNG3_LOLMU|nr:hypothetical protein QYE76_034853 [Lolium multiflorum]
MSYLSFSSDIEREGKPPGWRYWWDRVATPSSSSSLPTNSQEEDWEADGDHEEEGKTVADDDHEKEEEEEEEEAEEAAAAKKEARARAKAKTKEEAKAQPASTDDDEGAQKNDCHVGLSSSERIDSPSESVASSFFRPPTAAFNSIIPTCQIARRQLIVEEGARNQ